MKSFLELSRFHKQMIAVAADLLILPLTFYLAISLRYDDVSACQQCRQIIRLQPKRLLLYEMSEYAPYAIEQELRQLQKNLSIEREMLPFLGSVLAPEKCQRMQGALR